MLCICDQPHIEMCGTEVVQRKKMALGEFRRLVFWLQRVIKSNGPLTVDNLAVFARLERLLVQRIVRKGVQLGAFATHNGVVANRMLIDAG